METINLPKRNVHFIESFKYFLKKINKLYQITSTMVLESFFFLSLYFSKFVFILCYYHIDYP